MDKINFTGLKNIGSYSKNLPYYPKNQLRTHMIINLTDDYQGNDLTEFKEIAKKCRPLLGNMNFAKNSNFIHIMTSTTNLKDDVPGMAVNHIVIPARKETLPLFSYIAKLTRRIANMTDKEFIINNDFKYNNDGESFIFPLIKVSDLTKHNKQKTNQLLDEIYSPENNRKVSQIINNHIQQQMEDYLK